MTDNTQLKSPKKDVVAVLIYCRWKGGYKYDYTWQIFVNGYHWISGNSFYYFDHQARSAGVIALMKMDGWFTNWRLSE